MFGTSWHSYPKIYALGHREVKDIFKSEVLIQEKIDGSQISFGIFDGELKIKSKAKELILDAPEKMFSLAVDYIISIKDKLENGYTYRGEYLRCPKHNSLCYDRIPNNYIMIFDINSAEEEYLPYEAVCAKACAIGLETVPLLFTSSIIEDPTLLPAAINKVSCLGGNNMEGLVVKNYAMLGADKKVLMAKYVSENFKEIHKKNWKLTKPGKADVIQLIIGSLRTEARWAKAMQHLKERGELTESPQDIGKLMRELDSDLQAECTSFIAEKLLEWATPQILRGVKCGLPEWYKKRLIEDAYSEVV